MPEASSHRSAILSSIRQSLGAAQPEASIAAEYSAIPRNYKHSSQLDRHSLLELFEDRLREYDARVYRCIASEIPASIAGILNGRKLKNLAIPEGTPAAWLPIGFNFAIGTGFDAYQLDKTDGAISGCTVAIAETGSIVLQNSPSQGKRMLSLVADYHLCVVRAEQIVETVPESFDRLQDTPSLPTTFISGPSATADIEMTRIKGVHGPRFFDVLIVVE